MKENRKSWLIVSLFLLAIGSAVNAKTIYVDADRPPGGGGTNWSDAYKYLQDALADANASAKPVEIRVAQGTYKPDEGAGVSDGDREATFQLINGVTLKGGYAGDGEPDPDARDIDSYETILSGDLDGNDVQVPTSDLLSEPTRAENSYHVAYANDVNATAVLDGFTITAGNANGAAYPDNSAAGLRSSDSTLTLQNCTFVANSGSGSSGAMSRWDALDRIAEISNCNFTGNWGTALAGWDVALTNCQFNSNAGGGGGAFYSYGTSNNSLTDCVFNNNTSDSAGGGICTGGSDTNTTLSNCIFINNTAEYWGGGIYNCGTITLTNCTFIGNSTKTARPMFGNGGGGGMFTQCTGKDPTLINCTFIDNYSAATEGGGMYAELLVPTLVNCTFAGNHAGTSGGGVSLFVIEGQIPTFTNCVFAGNTADDDGGGFYSSHDYSKFTNCTFTNNHAAGDGGGYCLDDNLGTVDFNNCIFWGNTAYGEGPQIALKTPNPTVVTVNYSDVQGDWLDIYIAYELSTTLVWGSGNIDVDPCFVDADGADDSAGTEDDNLRLLSGSPCIDAGDNTAVPADTADLDGDGNTVEPTPLDLNGFARFIDDLCTGDTGNPGPPGPIVDMGAYEFLRSDIDSDGSVGFEDYCVIAERWRETSCGLCGGADLTCDGNVDWNDVRELVAHWLWGQ
ncbi:MAG: right-handed parallel beta-helix repeat-containing protein [Planctomycetota bacterium]